MAALCEPRRVRQVPIARLGRGSVRLLRSLAAVGVIAAFVVHAVADAAAAQPVPAPPPVAPLAAQPSVVTLEPDPAGTAVGQSGASGGGAAEYQQGGGFVLHTPDDRYVLTIGGYAQVDARTFPFFGADSGPSSTASFRRARVQLAGTVIRCVHWQLWVDFARGVDLLDAFIQWVPTSRVRLSVGNMVTPFGLERQWSGSTLPFMERSVALSAFGPDVRRIGVLLDWQLPDELFYAGIGLFRGSALSTSPAPDLVEDFDAMARVFVRPLRGDVVLHLGAAASVGRHEGNNQQAALGGSTMFGHRWFPADSGDAIQPGGLVARVGGELDFSWSRLRVSGELFYARVDHANRDEDAEGLGAYATAAVTLLGEPFSRKPLRGIRHVDLESGHAHLRGISDADVPWTLELAAGFDWARIEASLEETSIGGIRTVASYSSGRFQLNLGRQQWLRLSLMYAFGLFGDDAAPALFESGDARDVVHELGARAQVAF